MSTYTAPPKKRSLDLAGNVLRNPGATEAERMEAMDILSTWRKAHNYALNTFQAMLRGRCKDQGFSENEATVAQRLKRMPSIEAKLRKYKTLRLSQMQDIAGLRVVLPTINDVYNFHKSLLNSNAKHEAKIPAKDYIKHPKPDGYRSIHQIFKYRNTKHPELNILSVEVQIRTKLQHAWATAVETLGVLEHSSFKSGDGTQEFKRFLQLSSALISYQESQPLPAELQNIPIREIVQEFEELQTDLSIFKKLSGVSVVTQRVIGRDDGYYSLMLLDVNSEQLSITPFTEEQADIAEVIYSSLEERLRNDPSKFVVLVSVGDLKALRMAYPNYFLDTNLFIQTLKKICSTIKRD